MHLDILLFYSFGEMSFANAHAEEASSHSNMSCVSFVRLPHKLVAKAHNLITVMKLRIYGTKVQEEPAWK